MSPRNRFTTWGVLIASMMVLGLYALQYPLNHDVGWWLHVARSVLDGERIYRDVIEINPPLYGYLVMIPLMLADLTELPTPAVAKACILLTCALVVAVVHWLVQQMVQNRVTAFSTTLIIAIGVLGLPGLDFGQREHLMYALVVPYLLLDVYRAEGGSVTRGTSIGVGVAAGIGLALKPHFGLLFLLFEGTLALGGRDWKARLQRSEFLTVVVLGAGYGVLILASFPEYIELLWNSRHLYSAFAGADLNTLLVTPYSALVVGFGVGYVLARRPRSVTRSIVLRLAVFSVAAWITVVIQGKGWSYHFYPAYAAAVTGGLILSFDILVNRRGRGLQPSQVASAVACVVIATIVGVKHEVDQAAAMYRRAAIESRSTILRRAGAESFVLLSPMVSDGFPLVTYTALEWASPFPTLWWLQLRHGQSSSTALSPSASDDSVEAVYRAALVRDMSRHRPDIVFVDTAANPRFDDRVFPYVDYLSQEPRFRELWEAYTAIGASGRFEVYQRSGEDMVYAP